MCVRVSHTKCGSSHRSFVLILLLIAKCVVFMVVSAYSQLMLSATSHRHDRSTKRIGVVTSASFFPAQSRYALVVPSLSLPLFRKTNMVASTD